MTGGHHGQLGARAWGLHVGLLQWDPGTKPLVNGSEAWPEAEEDSKSQSVVSVTKLWYMLLNRQVVF